MEREVDLVQLADDLPDAVVVARDGSIRWANSSVLGLIGYPADELFGVALATVLPEVADAADQGGSNGVLRPGVRVERTARHRDGSEVPVEVTVVDLGRPGTVALVLRDAAIRRSLVGQLVANTELMTAMTTGSPVDETIRLAAHHLRSILRADACWVALTPEGASRLAVVARDEAPGATGVAPPTPSESTDSTDSSDSSECGEAGPLLVVELGHADLAGLIAVARRCGTRDFTDADRDVARQFAAVVAMALDLDLARRRAAIADASAEHARIARDLHDTVMQRLFAEGLLLETAAPLAPSHVAERIHSAVCNLDDVIREIRETIFEPPSVRNQAG